MFLLPSLAYVCSSPQYRGQGENVANNQSGCVTFYVNEVITVDLAVFCGFFWLHFWRFLCIQQDWRFVVFYCFLLAVFLFILYLQKLYTDFFIYFLFVWNFSIWKTFFVVFTYRFYRFYVFWYIFIFQYLYKKGTWPLPLFRLPLGNNGPLLSHRMKEETPTM